jgi:hypothetical protein
MIEIDKNTWYANLYKWSLKVKSSNGDWRAREMLDEEYIKTNLCSFFKIIIYGMLVTFLSYFSLIFFMFSLFILPFILFPFWSAALGYIAVFGIISIFLLVLVAPFAIASKISDMRRNKEEKKSGIVFLAKEYYKGYKEKYCATIKIGNRK